MNNNISFRSKINFVDKDTFVNIAKGKKISPETRTAAFADEFFSPRVRSCTAGGILSVNEESYGFHFYDDSNIGECGLNTLKRDIALFDNSPQRAFIIGSKRHKCRPFSKRNLVIIKKYLDNNINNVSVFEGHTDKYAQSSFHYDLKTDTYTVFTQFFKNGKEKCVNSLRDLLNNFKNIKIANGDVLFIGNQQITKDMYPSIF